MLSLRRAMKTQGTRRIALPFLQPRRYWGRWLAPRPGRFTPGKETGTHCTRGRVGLGDGPNGYGRSLPQRWYNSGLSRP